MQIAKWLAQPDGSVAWVIGDRILGKVYPVDGVWRTWWSGYGGCMMLPDDFLTAHDACLAAEKYWPPLGRPFWGWLESKNGGYFRKLTNKRTVYVRKAENGWYAVQTDGKVLGKGGNVSWFTTATDACAAVEKELHTPVDADPFVSTRDQWHWIKFRSPARAA